MKLSIVLLLASFVLLATSKPARKGGAREDHSPIPLHLRELYNKLEEGSASLVSGANTVHSLQSIAPTAPQCGVFNFSLSEIDAHHEQIKKVELNLYMIRREATASPLFVTVKSENENIEASDIKVQKVMPKEESGWIVFQVRHQIASLIKSGEEQAVFKVLVYQSMAENGNNEGHLDCELSPLTFVNSLADENQSPYLTVQSHDSRLDKINYNTLLESQKRMASSRRKRRGNPFPSNSTEPPVTTTNNSPITSSTGRPSPPVCGVHEFIIPLTQIYPHIILPHEINVGVCGGRCNVPRLTSFVHHILLKNLQTTPEGDLKFKPVCAPVGFESQEAIVSRYNRNTQRYESAIIRIKDIRVSACSCVDVLDFD